MCIYKNKIENTFNTGASYINNDYSINIGDYNFKSIEEILLKIQNLFNEIYPCHGSSEEGIYIYIVLINNRE